jgi:hypothetical protein
MIICFKISLYLFCQIFTCSTLNFERVFQNLVPVLNLRQKPQNNSKNVSVRFKFSTDTKSSKTAQKNFSKNRQDIFSTRYQS